MLPCVSALQLTDGDLMDTVLLSNDSLHASICADGSDVVFGQFRQRAIGAPISAALTRHVSHVVSLRPSEQVIGIDTARVVASVQETRSGRISAQEFPRQTMCEKAPVLRSGEPAVAIRISRAIPEPTSICLQNPGPEPIRNGKWYLAASHATSRGQVVRGACGTPLLPRLAHFTPKTQEKNDG
jgi:hypothetical protein